MGLNLEINSKIKIMNYIKKWSVSIASGVDSVLSKVENHESIISASLQDMQKSLGALNVKLKRVRKDREDLEVRLKNTYKEIEAWEQRALKVSETDEARALECLKRKNKAEENKEYLKKELSRQAKIEVQLQKEGFELNKKFEELKRRKNEYAARELQNKVLNCGEGISNITDLVDDVLGRWESKLGIYDQEWNDPHGLDTLENEFVSAEETENLKSQLEALRHKNANQKES
jgi:phage shock protein A